MIPKGTPVIAGDPNLGDLYYAVLAEDWSGQGVKNPLVAIRTVLRYPIQTAMINSNAVSDNPPLPEGMRVRLLVISLREGAPQEDYAASFARAQAGAVRHYAGQGRPDCLEVIAGHRPGGMSRRRSFCDK